MNTGNTIEFSGVQHLEAIPSYTEQWGQDKQLRNKQSPEISSEWETLKRVQTPGSAFGQRPALA